MTSRRSNRAGPAFSGNNLIQSNPLPALTSIPSFSYGSPQSVLPKPMNVRDTKINMTDALDKADAAARARLEAAAQERRLAEQRAADAAAESARQAARQVSVEPSMTARKRSLRSQSVVSQDDNFYEGDETSLEIHRIIESARNPIPESSMLRARSVNAGTKEPRSAMKGSREEALRPSAKTRARHTAGRRTAPMTPIPIDGEREATFDEENQALGLAPRLASPSLVSPSPTPQPLHEDPPPNSDIFGGRQDSPPDTIGYREDVPNIPMSPESPVDTARKAKTPVPTSEKPSATSSWFSLGPAKTGFRATINGIRKTAVILGIFVKNIFGPLLYYLLLGFFIFGITTLSYNFVQGSSYSTSLPPSSSDEMVRRLMALEKQVNNFGHGRDQERKSHKAMEQQLSSIRNAMADYSSLSSQLDKYTRSQQTDQRASATAVSTMSAQIEQLDKAMKRNDAALKEQKGNSQQIFDQLAKVQGEVKNINVDLERIKKSQQLSERALKSIEELLPKQIAARIDPQTGNVIVAPELLRYLQAALRNNIREEIDKLGHTTGVPSVPRGSNGVGYSWDEFLKINAEKLRGYLGQMSDQKWRDAIADGVVVTREDMVKVIRQQLESVREIAERDNQTLMRKLVLEAESAARDVVSTAATSISTAALAAVTNYMRNFKGSSSASSQYGDALIKAALHQYSATVLQKPDYALLRRGTLIDPRLTSSTFDPYDSPGFFGKFSAFLRPGPNEPAYVLTESTNVGDCWSFPQASGHVSMLLAEPIYPTDVTIDHVPRGISGDDSSAPQEVEFWIHIEDEYLRGQVGKAAAAAVGDVSDSPSTRHYLANGYVRVASFIYDINSQYSVQTFALPVEVQKLGVSVRSVSFRILSNWGHKEYTSIYRLRVHGEPLNGNAEVHDTNGPIRGL